jgi:hypothetical protein
MKKFAVVNKINGVSGIWNVLAANKLEAVRIFYDNNYEMDTQAIAVYEIKE